MRMKGKVAIVTGGGSGIGRATAILFAAEGASVACVDRVEAAARETAKIVESTGGQAIALTADVTDAASCARMVEAAIARFGGLTTLVNSAGIGPPRAGRSPSAEDFRHVVDVNLTGTFLASHAAAAALSAAGGAITNLSSIYGLVGGSRSPAYAASKGGVTNLTRQMALDWAPTVRVNCVCPGHIETPLTAGFLADPKLRDALLAKYPAGRFGKPEEIASA